MNKGAKANLDCHWMNKPAEDRTINRFAQALSVSGSISQAARDTGINYEYGRALFKRIKRKLGSQAI